MTDLNDFTDDDPTPLIALFAATPIDQAPRTGCLLRLLVDYSTARREEDDIGHDAPLDDTRRYAWTVGWNNFDNDGEDTWQMAGWRWDHDHFTEGHGTPVAFLPFFDERPVTPVGPAETAGGEVTYRECMWAEMKPDMYGGDTCDQVVPGWSCYCAGDKQGEDGVECLELAAKTFAPGTKVVVSEPCCPNCGEPHWPGGAGAPNEIAFPSKCDCGFDWDAWTADQYA